MNRFELNPQEAARVLNQQEAEYQAALFALVEKQDTKLRNFFSDYVNLDTILNKIQDLKNISTQPSFSDRDKATIKEVSNLFTNFKSFLDESGGALTNLPETSPERLDSFLKQVDEVYDKNFVELMGHSSHFPKDQVKEILEDYRRSLKFYLQDSYGEDFMKFFNEYDDLQVRRYGIGARNN